MPYEESLTVVVVVVVVVVVDYRRLPSMGASVTRSVTFLRLVPAWLGLGLG